MRSDQVLNSCKLREGPAVLTFVVTQGTDCEPQVDRVERMRREFPDVDFAVVLSGLERDEAVQIVRRRGWRLPVGLDPDGAVTNLYGIGVCPTTVFSDRERPGQGDRAREPHRAAAAPEGARDLAVSAEPELTAGWVDAELAEEFPELGLVSVSVEARSGRSPFAVRDRLRVLSDRFTGSKVIHMRQDPVPWAYRVFFRQVGVDPDSDRTPVERIAVERLEWGGLRSQNLLDDALVIATVETGVPVIAFDADTVGKHLGLRLSRSGEQLGASRPLSVRQIVVADEDRPLSVLFGEIAEERGVTRRTKRMVLVALRVKGVPEISVEEALWTAADVLTENQ